MNELTGADRRHLRSLANPKKAVVQVGEAGLTEGVVAATDAALEDHELIKVRLAADRSQRRKLAETLAAKTGSTLAGLVGRVAVLYRSASDPEKRKIRLPSETKR